MFISYESNKGSINSTFQVIKRENFVRSDRIVQSSQKDVLFGTNSEPFGTNCNPISSQ